MQNRKHPHTGVSRGAKIARQSRDNFKFELKPWYHNIPDDELIADLRQVANKLGVKTLTQKAYRAHSKYGAETLRDRFGLWSIVLEKAGLQVLRHNDVRNETILADIQRVARDLKVTRLTGTKYYSLGKFRDGLISSRFGSWTKAVQAAGLQAAMAKNVPVDELFENLEQVWRTLGRQPRRADMMPPLSKFGIFMYDVRYHGFRNALRVMVEWKAMNRNSATPVPPPPPPAGGEKRLRRFDSARKIGLRLRYRILSRDHFTCQACGRSPATDPNVQLEIDHIVPWSAGGESVVTNLQTLCRECNRGKSNQ